MEMINWELRINQSEERRFTDQDYQEIENIEIPEYGTFTTWVDPVDNSLNSEFYTAYVGAYFDVVDVFKKYSMEHPGLIVSLIWENEDESILPQKLVFQDGNLKKYNARLVFDMEVNDR